jgi:hypothetical protein
VLVSGRAVVDHNAADLCKQWIKRVKRELYSNPMRFFRFKTLLGLMVLIFVIAIIFFYRALEREIKRVSSTHTAPISSSTNLSAYRDRGLGKDGGRRCNSLFVNLCPEERDI